MVSKSGGDSFVGRDPSPDAGQALTCPGLVVSETVPSPVWKSHKLLAERGGATGKAGRVGFIRMQY